MPSADSAALIVARFLKANNYTQSYQAFIDEAGLAEDAGDVSSADLTLERLLEEKRLFDQSVNFEKLSVTSHNDKGWAPSAPSTPTIIESLPGRANLLNVHVNSVANGSILLASTSDRRINVISLPDLCLQSSWSGLQDAPVLSQLVLRDRYHFSSSMAGAMVVGDVKTGELIAKRKDHAKYIVSLAVHDTPEQTYIASAGWDSVIKLYKLHIDDSRTLVLDEPLATITLPTKPESILFTKHSLNGKPILVVTRTDSSHLHFWSVGKEPNLLGRQNLAPHSNAWVAFTPSSIALCPTDNSLVAIATNSTPHMKVIVAKLLIPDQDKQPERTTPPVHTAREEALVQQAIAETEHKAIQLHCNSMSAQTPYSNPLVVWRPDGRGVWVNSDDGIIRGIDVLSGKVVAELRGHDAGAKVRTLWAGNVHDDNHETLTERLVSGGFDHKLIIWGQ